MRAPGHRFTTLRSRIWKFSPTIRKPPSWKKPFLRQKAACRNFPRVPGSARPQKTTRWSEWNINQSPRHVRISITVKKSWSRAKRAPRLYRADVSLSWSGLDTTAFLKYRFKVQQPETCWPTLTNGHGRLGLLANHIRSNERTYSPGECQKNILEKTTNPMKPSCDHSAKSRVAWLLFIALP